MQTVRYHHFIDGAIAVVTTHVARQGVMVKTEEPYMVKDGENPDDVIPYADLRMQASDVVGYLVEAREVLMRRGYASSCVIANTLAVCAPEGAYPRVATLYGDPSGLGISGRMAEPLASILGEEGIKVRVD